MNPQRQPKNPIEWELKEMRERMAELEGKVEELEARKADRKGPRKK